MKDIVIIGSGGFGKEVAWLIEEINAYKKEWNIIGFINNEPNSTNDTINGYKVLGDISWLETNNSTSAIIAIGDSKTRSKISEQLSNNMIDFPILIHPSVIMSNLVKIGEGAIICAGCILTVNINIGNHVIINLDSTIGHDAKIDDFATIAPSVNVSGHVHIESYTNIGTSSSIIQNITIGQNTIIGAGSVVVKDIPPFCTAVGIPAKPIKFI